MNNGPLFAGLWLATQRAGQEQARKRTRPRRVRRAT